MSSLLLLLLLLSLFRPSPVLSDSQYTGLIERLAEQEEQIDLRLQAIGERVARLEVRAKEAAGGVLGRCKGGLKAKAHVNTIFL